MEQGVMKALQEPCKTHFPDGENPMNSSGTHIRF